MTPGIHNLPSAEYLRDPCPKPSLSASIAKVLLTQSPRHAWLAHPKLNPDWQPEEDGKFDIGLAAHALLLEGEDRMEIVDAEDWRTKAAREQRDAIRAQGKLPVLRRYRDSIYAMVDKAREAIRNCTDLSGMTLADGYAERTLVYDEKGTWFRAKLDWISNDRTLILDYKTTDGSAEPNAWIRTMLGQQGEMQSAFYLDSNVATGGPENSKFVFMVQETYAPYACSFIGMSPAFVELGMRKVRYAAAMWADCLQRNQWPAYPTRICWAEPPTWAQAQWDEVEITHGIEYDPAKLFTAMVPPRAEEDFA